MNCYNASTDRYNRHRNTSATVAFRYQVGDKQGVGRDKDFVSLIWWEKGLLVNFAAFSSRFLFREKVLPLLTMDPWTAAKTFYEINPDWILSWTPTRCACNLTLVPEVPSKFDPIHSSLVVFIKPKQRATLQWIYGKIIDANDIWGWNQL